MASILHLKVYIYHLFALFMSNLKFLGRALGISLELCQALENRNLTHSYELQLKKKIYEQHHQADSFFVAQMQEHVFEDFISGPRSWIQHFLYLRSPPEDTLGGPLVFLGRNN